MFKKLRRSVLWTPLWPLNPFYCGLWFYFLKFMGTCSFDSCRVAGTLLYEVVSWFKKCPGTKRRMNSKGEFACLENSPSGRAISQSAMHMCWGLGLRGIDLSWWITLCVWGGGEDLRRGESQGKLALSYNGGFRSHLCGCTSSSN